MAHEFVVLTGDLIASSDFTATEVGQALDHMRRAAQDVSDWEGTQLAGFARRGGDGWQYAISPDRHGLRVALYLRAALRSLGKTHATRIAIAEGPGTLPADRDPNGAHGPAFTASGRLLEALPRHVAMAHATGGALSAAVRLADHVSAGWTPAQARAVQLMLPPGDRIRADAAASLGITRQAVNQALWSAGFPALSDALSFIEADHART